MLTDFLAGTLLGLGVLLLDGWVTSRPEMLEPPTEAGQCAAQKWKSQR